VFSNPHLFNLAEADLIPAAVVELGGFDVGMPGHAPGDVDIAATFQIVGEADGAEGVIAYGGFYPGVFGAPAHHNAAYFSAAREFQKKCRDLGFKGNFFADEIYAGSMYPPGSKSYPMLTSEIQMAKYLVRSLVGHSGLGMEAAPCHPHFTGRVHPQALCQATWGVQTLNPCRPTMTYYMWRNVATIMDDFYPAEFRVKFSDEKGLLFFRFERGNNERMVAVWIDGPHQDAVAQTKAEVSFAGLRARQARILDIVNGTEQELDFVANGWETVVKGLLIEDYPVFIQVNQ